MGKKNFFLYGPCSHKSVLANGFKNQTLTVALCRKLAPTFHFAHRPGKSHFFIQKKKKTIAQGDMC